jgi:hypothetical protein
MEALPVALFFTKVVAIDQHDITAFCAQFIN